MNEEQWYACTKTAEMLEFLRGKATDRKLRLFACAVCRCAWDTFTSQRVQRAVEVGERYADGHVTDEDLNLARSQAWASVNAIHEQMARSRRILMDKQLYVYQRRRRLACDVAYVHKPFLIGRLNWHPRDNELNAVGPHLLRDIFGTFPFHPLTPIAPCILAWNAGLVVKLAEAAYQHRSLPSGHLDNARLAVLVDALEDAGCTDAKLLEHLRSDGQHVRGCWAVDAVLGRA